MSGWISGLTQGFVDRKTEYEQEQQARADQARQQEQSLFQALLASPDPEIQAAAAAGLLQGAQPGKRKPGLQGWLGEMQQNPAYGTILGLIKTPVTKRTETPGLPSADLEGANVPQRAIQPTVQAPGAEAPAAMPPTALTSPGAPPPPPMRWRQNAPPAVGRVDYQTTARKIFPTAGDTEAERYRGRVQGRVQAVEEALGRPVEPEFVRQIALEDAGYSGGIGGTGAQTVGEGNIIPDSTSPTGYSQILYDRQTGLEAQRIPAMDPRTARSAGGVGGYRGIYWAQAAARLGLDPSTMKPEESTRIAEEVNTVLREQAGIRQVGKAEGVMQAPISPQTAQATGLPVGSKPSEVAGQTVPTMAQQDRRRSVETLKQSLQHIEGSLIKVLPSQTELAGFAGWAPGAISTVRRRNPAYRNQYAQLDSALNNIVNVVARSVGEQRGTQTEQDALRAEAAIVSLRDSLLGGDTRESAQARITETLGVLDRLLERLPASAQAGGPPAPTGAGGPTPAPGRAVKDASGNWVIRQ